MTTVLIDYDSGNLHSAEKAFQRMALEVNAGAVIVSSKPEDVAAAERIVLPGDGAFPACKRALDGAGGLCEALIEAVEMKGRPFLGICVGMQLMARQGHEYETVKGLGWIDGEVVPIAPQDPSLKVPHMGWNDLVLTAAHPVLDGIETGAHAYFVHSFHMQVASAGQLLATAEYGAPITAIVSEGTKVGMQFHPEKSQASGLRMIANFLRWRP
ncbi:MAG: imidazole glycerol phosphate synthase subunit HisH [Pseudomonadota bacterium]